MATGLRKMGVYLGLVEDDDYTESGGSESYGALARDPQYHRREVEVAQVRTGYETATTEAEVFDDAWVHPRDLAAARRAVGSIGQ